MSFMAQLAFYFGIVDAVLIMAFGVIVAFCFIFAQKDTLEKIWERVFPALLSIIGASVAAALVLGAIRWLTGLGM